MRITFAAIPAHGHLYPLIPLALAARDAGHEVRIATGDPFVDNLPLPTDNCFPRGMTLHDAEEEVKEHGFDHTDPLGFPLTLFGKVTAGHCRQGLRPLWQRERPDLVVYELTNLGASQAASEFGIPVLGFSIGMDFGMAATLYERVGLAIPATFDPVPPGWPQSPTTIRRIPIRTVAWSSAHDPLPSWMSEPGDPIAYLTLGTVAFGAVEVLRRSVAETAARGFRVLVAAGSEGDPAALDPLPDGVHVERFVDQSAVLALADVAVHHGGTGTVLGCLAHGVPQVLTPQGADQFFNAAALHELGLGRVVQNDAGPGALGTAVSHVLEDAGIGAQVKAFADRIAAMPSPRQVCARLPELVSTLRSDT